MFRISTKLYQQVKITLILSAVVAAMLSFALMWGIAVFYYERTMELVQSECELLLIEQCYREDLSIEEKQGVLTQKVKEKLVEKLPYWWEREKFIFIRKDGNEWGRFSTDLFYYSSLVNISDEEKENVFHEALLANGKISFYLDYAYGVPYRSVASKLVDRGDDAVVVILVSYLLGFDSIMMFLSGGLIAGLIMLVIAYMLSGKIAEPLMRGCRRLIEEIRFLPNNTYKRPMQLFYLQDELQEIAEEIEGMRAKILMQMSELEEYAREQTEFASNVAHELQTPIASTGNWVQVLLDLEDISKEQRKEYLQRIGVNVNTLSHVVKNLLVVSRLGRAVDGLVQSKVPQEEELGLKKHLEELSVLPRQKWLYKEQRVIWSVDETLRLRTVKVLLDIVFANIFDNALKYAPENTDIIVTAEFINDRCLLTVSNEGEVVTEAEAALLMERFYRTEKGEKRVQGWGIGLYLVRKAVDILKAELSIVPRKHGGLDIKILFSNGK